MLYFHFLNCSSRKKTSKSEKKPVADSPGILSTSDALPIPSNSSTAIRVIKSEFRLSDLTFATS